MSKQLKRPKVIWCYGVFIGGLNGKWGWDDVRLAWRLNRHSYEEQIVTFNTEKSLRREYQDAVRRMGENPQWMTSSIEERLRKDVAILKALETEQYYFEAESERVGDVFIQGLEGLTKKNLEPAIKWYLRSQFGLTNVKLKWPRRKR